MRRPLATSLLRLSPLLLVLATNAHANVQLRITNPHPQKPGALEYIEFVRTLNIGDPTPNPCYGIYGCSLRGYYVNPTVPGIQWAAGLYGDNNKEWDRGDHQTTTKTLGDLAAAIPIRTVASYARGLYMSGPAYICVAGVIDGMTDARAGINPVGCADVGGNTATCTFNLAQATLTHTGKAGVELGGAASKPTRLDLTCDMPASVTIGLLGGNPKIPMGGAPGQYATIDVGAGPGAGRKLDVPAGTTSVVLTSHLYGVYKAGTYTGEGILTVTAD
ncbi:hypothetical protein CK910_06840 [Aeromonas sp. CA23]|uniref:hypothetical protein n=1 Tax=Aeromonas sp. CA23 TaxID=2033032 RepID=UPI000BFB8EB9|nr:hypothetical protein [Aeromonas sp. CA23]ATL98237.1 hypothetical protein CK910_06840 [Aeromonas sp. CA23]